MSELEIWKELGNIYYNTGAYDESVRAYTKAIELDQDCGQSYCNLASIYVNQGRHTEAIALLQRGIEHLENGQDKALLWDRLGDVYRKLYQYENALPAYRKAIELDSENATFQDNLTKAEKDSTQNNAPASNPASEEPAPTKVEIEKIIEKIQDKDDAPAPGGQSEMDETTRARANALLQVGLLYWRKEDYEEASQSLNAAIDLASSFSASQFQALCYSAIALVETKLEKTEEAIRAYERAASLDPEHVFPWNTLGVLYSQLNRYEEARDAFQKAVERNPKDAASWNGLGDVQHKLGNTEDAIAAYQSGNVYDKQNHEEATAATNETALDAGQENPHIWEEMGNIYCEAGEYRDAINAYSQAIELQDKAADKASLWGRIADAYQQLHDSENAVVAYHKAIELDPDNTELQNSLAKLVQASESADVEIETNNSQAPESAVEDPASSKPAWENIPSTDDEKDANVVPNSSGAAQEAEPETDYWVFKSRRPYGSPVKPKAQPSIPMTKAQTSEPPTFPASKLPRLTAQAVLESPVLVVESAPKIEAAAEMEQVDSAAPKEGQASPISEKEAQEDELFDTKPLKLEDINPQAKINQTADQFEKNLHSLKNDIAAYQRVTEINPKNDRAWDALGNMYESAGLHSEAIAAFEQAISLDAKREVYHYHLGLAYAAQLNYEKAIQALQKVIELNPGYILAHCALAGYFRRINKGAEAEGHIAIARPAMENENEYNRACFESICGNTDQALELLEAALDKQQIQLDWVRNDPDLEFVRSDPRFEALLNKNWRSH